MYDKCKYILLKLYESTRYKVPGIFKSFRKRTMDILFKKDKKLYEKAKRRRNEGVWKEYQEIEKK